MTHAASGIGEAFLDGIPMLVIAGGIRRDSGPPTSCTSMDQHAMLKPITKGTLAGWNVMPTSMPTITKPTHRDVG